MVQIGRYKIGAAQISMAIVFIVSSICAIVVSFNQMRPEWPMPLSSLILINESLALLVTLLYGIVAHLVLVLIKRLGGN